MFNFLNIPAFAFVKNHKAQIMVGAGIVGNTAATIIACKQTLTAKDIIADHKKRREEIDNALEICKHEIKIYDIANATTESSSKYYTEQEPCSTSDYLKYTQYLDKDFKKELLKVYSKTALNFIRHYAVAGALFIASNISICAGTGVLTKQVAGLSTSLAAVTTAFGDYRKRVQNAIGEEAENRIYTNEQVKVNKYKDVDDEGNEIEKEEVVITTDGKHDPYALLLDRCSYQYANDIDATLTNLKMAEKEANRMLMGRGMLTLNEVYELLGYGKTAAGAQVGWIYDPDPNVQAKHGDGYVSFGLFDHKDENGNITQDPLFLNDQWVSIRNSHLGNRQSDTDEYDIWLHFNVDGPIIEFMDRVPGKPL